MAWHGPKQAGSQAGRAGSAGRSWKLWRPRHPPQAPSGSSGGAQGTAVGQVNAPRTCRPWACGGASGQRLQRGQGGATRRGGSRAGVLCEVRGVHAGLGLIHSSPRPLGTLAVGVGGHYEQLWCPLPAGWADGAFRTAKTDQWAGGGHPHGLQGVLASWPLPLSNQRGWVTRGRYPVLACLSPKLVLEG